MQNDNLKTVPAIIPDPARIMGAALAEFNAVRQTIEDWSDHKSSISMFELGELYAELKRAEDNFRAAAQGYSAAIAKAGK